MEMISLCLHCQGIERRMRYLLARCRVLRGMISRWKRSCRARTVQEEDTLPISKVQSMERDDIQVEKLSLSTHCPGIERRMRYL